MRCGGRYQIGLRRGQSFPAIAERPVDQTDVLLSAEIPRVFLGTMGVPLKVQDSKAQLDSTRTPVVVYTTFSQSVANQPCFLGSGV